MASFYSAPGGNPNVNGGGYSNAGGGGGGGGGSTDNFQQFNQSQQPQQQQQQPGISQWQAQPQGQGQPYGQQMQQQQQQQQQQPTAPQPFWSSATNVQQAATQAAAGFVAQAATGNFSSEKVLSQGIDSMQKAFGGGIPGMDYIMRMLRSYFAVDNRYVKRKIIIILFPFKNQQWRRNVSTVQTT